MQSQEQEIEDTIRGVNSLPVLVSMRDFLRVVKTALGAKEFDETVYDSTVKLIALLDDLICKHKVRRAEEDLQIQEDFAAKVEGRKAAAAEGKLDVEGFKKYLGAAASGLAGAGISGGSISGGKWLKPLPLTPERLAEALDLYLQQMETTEGLAEDSAPAVITFALAALGLAKTRTSILQATEVSLEGSKEGETSFVIGHLANFPGCSDDPEFCRQLELSFADFLTRRNTPDAPPEIATP
jgi:hypothetical protein